MPSDPSTLQIDQLIRDHAGTLFRYAYRLCGSATDAEDLVQQTLLSAWRHRDQLQDARRTRAWLCAILRHAFYKSLRRQADTSPLDAQGELPDPGTTPASDVDEERLQAALNRLPVAYRLPLVMYYFEELTYQQIAEQLEVPVGTVMSRLSRGKQALRGILEPELAAHR